MVPTYIFSTSADIEEIGKGMQRFLFFCKNINIIFFYRAILLKRRGLSMTNKYTRRWAWWHRSRSKRNQGKEI
ncbi:hypothetical protein D1970_20045 [Mesobacillus zeae]|uniref:Uncharacterized protein n=1 Tax=Mesobacillus zeae TaxID=1917180 RepID=A0A398AY83_9BACI|nr:hypothetical protein D1970_20045 [Mesobacillus zeae]